MPKKRKTLPKNFEEMLKTADIDELKAVYDKCELTAYTGYSKSTALGLRGVPDELVRWLVGQGLDVDTPDCFHKTPLQSQISSFGSIGTIELLLELGADIEAKYKLYNYTPLHYAAQSRRADVVKLLIDRGADMFARDWNKLMPLELMLSVCRPADIAETAETAEVFLNAGASDTRRRGPFRRRKREALPNAGVCVTDKSKEFVAKIGTDFEFYRDGFNKDYLDETLAGLAKLYRMFGVEPVPARRKHDGVSPITVTHDKWWKQHDELWQLLVPGSGHADTVQGEVIRITGRVAYEIMDNGGINWDSDYKKMLDCLAEHLSSGTPLPPDELSEAKEIIKTIYKGEADNEPERLSELAVHWVIANPDPVKLGEVSYIR